MIAFDGAAAGIPAGVDVDAVAVPDPAGIVVSFDTTVDLGGGLVVADEDAVRYDGAFTLAFDGSAEGVPEELDLDGLGIELPGGALLLSFDGGGQIAAVDFDDDTVLRLDGGAWSVVFEVDALHPAFEGGDVVALPEPGAVLGLAAGALALVGLGWRRRRRDRWP